MATEGCYIKCQSDMKARLKVLSMITGNHNVPDSCFILMTTIKTADSVPRLKRKLNCSSYERKQKKKN